MTLVCREARIQSSDDCHKAIGKSKGACILEEDKIDASGVV